jgi:WD40 repeat protein
MAPIEVIDLISDSEDDDHLSGKAASSTLKSFQPRKDKQLPRAHASTASPLPGPQQRTLAPLAQPTQYAQIVPQTQYMPIASLTQYTPIVPSTQHYAPIAPSSQHAPIAPSTIKYTTIAPGSLQQYTNVGSDSIHGILRNGIQYATASAGLAASQPAIAPHHQANVQREMPRQATEPQEVYKGRYAIPGNVSEATIARDTGGLRQEERQRHFQDYHRKEAERKGVVNLPQGQAEINPSSHLYTGVNAGGQGISASTMADITNYAEPGEDLDWTKISEPRERKRLQNTINGRKYRERRLAAEGQGGSGGNYPGASGVGSYMSPGYGQRQSGFGGKKPDAGHAPVAPMLPLAQASTAQPNGHPFPALQQSLIPSTNNFQPALPHGRRLSPQANGDSGPTAKRPKLVHIEEADDFVGMREARRLSAATIGILEAGHDSNGATPSLSRQPTSHDHTLAVPNSHVEVVSHQTSPNPTVVGPTSLGPDQSNGSVATAGGIPPANNNSTAKGKAKGKAKAKVNNSQPTLEEFTANYIKEYQQKVVKAMESAFGKPRKPPQPKNPLQPKKPPQPRKPSQPKSKDSEGAKCVKEHVIQVIETAFGTGELSDTEDDAPQIWERPRPKPGTQHLDDSDSSSSDESSSDIVPPTSKSAPKSTRPFSGRGTTRIASDTEYTSGSDERPRDAGPSSSRPKNLPERPSDSEGPFPLFDPERSKARSLAKDQSDSESSSPDVVPAKPAHLPSEAKPMSTSLMVEDPSDSDSSSPDVVPARSNPKGSAGNPNGIDGSSLDVIPASSKPMRPVENRSDSDSSSPDFVPAKPKPERQSLTGNMASSVPQTNDALRIFMSQPSVPVPKLAINNDKGSQKRIETNAKPKTVPQGTRPTNNSGSNHGIPYTKEEDDLLKYLREERNVSWDEMIDHFSGRTRGSLQVRYSTKLKNRDSTTINRRASEARAPSFPIQVTTAPMPSQEYAAPARRVPKATTRNDGFVSWGEIKAKRIAERAVVIPDNIKQELVQPVGSAPGVAIPASIPRLLRSREMGNICGRKWSSKSRLKVPDELQNHVLDTLGPRKFFHGASRDVTCVAWANDGNRFAAGAIAIDDERSMQYNRPNNLLLGNNERNSLQELPEHHVSRPAVSDSNNVNSLHAMQETQDPRLFKTVAAVAFSGDSQALYSAGGDGIVRMYDSSNGECRRSFSQGAEVVLLTANSRGLLASGCHRSDDSSISVLSDQLDSVCNLGPSRTNVQSSLPIFPSALKWGAERYSSLLLAGFASDSYDEDRLAAGEVCLWDVAAGNKIELPTVRNVFDVAWNPSPSAASTLFAVACARSGRTYRSSIECFAPHQGRARSVLKWDCQAFDINDVLYCPHDDNLIAAGATDGKVYVWDKRFARNQGEAPLHIFAHGSTKNVLDPERDPEIADTGVRFLSWSSTGDRLYSGSSDGTVKVWNPYRMTEDALVRDVATFNSAIMSGAFSPDYRELLIGEDQGQLNLLGIDREERSVRAAKKFDYCPAAKPPPEDDKLAPARELLNSQQIEFKPMGALPIRQAVQGPNYQGPFLAPSEEQRQHLVTDYELALQQEKKALAGFPRDAEIGKFIKSAQLQVSQTRDALHRAQQKADDSKLLAPAALLLQEKFLESRHEWKKGKIGTGAKTCRLDCNYLPAAGDEDGEAPDDRRSEQRIPGSIRPQRKILNAGDMTNSEIAEAGLTSKCIACTGPAAKPKPKRGLPLCESCSLSRSGLTARCGKCATPTRPNVDGRPNICESCNFHCFRCGSVAVVSPQGDTVTCESCGTEWEAGALGYEVKRSLKSAVTRVRDEELLDREMDSYEMESLEQRMARLFGDDERERLAGGWAVGRLPS